MALFAALFCLLLCFGAFDINQVASANRENEFPNDEVVSAIFSNNPTEQETDTQALSRSEDNEFEDKTDEEQDFSPLVKLQRRSTNELSNTQETYQFHDLNERSADRMAYNRASQGDHTDRMKRAIRKAIKKHEMKKRFINSLAKIQAEKEKPEDSETQELDKRALDSLGGFNVHGWKRGDKRALDSLGGFNVHGWKRDDDKRALDSLGGFNVHGWKRDDKRALDSLGGFNVHGWKRDDDKR